VISVLSSPGVLLYDCDSPTWGTWLVGLAPVTSLAWSNGFDHLATGHDDGTIEVWDVYTGQRQYSWQAHSGAVHSMDFSSDDQRLVSGGDGTTVTVWDLTWQ
jgi:WD40 repeat protein